MTTIKKIFDAYAKATDRVWEHDRSSTLGASAAFTCLRRAWFSMNSAAHDVDYDDSYGGRKRGDVVEAHWVVPALRAGMPPGCELLWAGEDQRTLVDGYISATPDGLIVNRSNQDVTIEGVVVPPNGCIGVEIKSIDPRINLVDAKAEHIGQVHVQMGLIRTCTEYRPEIVLVIYVDASFFDDVEVFHITFDPAVYAAARQRALDVMMAEAALALAPEGKIAGGKECQYCPFQSQCIGITVGAIPKDHVPLSPELMATAKDMATEERRLDAACKAAETAHGEVKEKIKSFLRDAKTRKVVGEGWSITYFPVKGRKTTDFDAVTAAGIDLSPFTSEGDPSERLTVKISN